MDQFGYIFLRLQIRERAPYRGARFIFLTIFWDRQSGVYYGRNDQCI
jgi:hypothetical protein